jgi:hypothetical protein
MQGAYISERETCSNRTGERSDTVSSHNVQPQQHFSPINRDVTSSIGNVQVAF